MINLITTLVARKDYKYRLFDSKYSLSNQQGLNLYAVECLFCRFERSVKVAHNGKGFVFGVILTHGNKIIMSAVK